eukprot:20416-Heterococcus_DN1.PRE.4
MMCTTLIHGKDSANRCCTYNDCTVQQCAAMRWCTRYCKKAESVAAAAAAATATIQAQQAIALHAALATARLALHCIYQRGSVCLSESLRLALRLAPPRSQRCQYSRSMRH